MEYCGAGSMSDLMKKGQFAITEEEIRFIMAQILLGLAHLHSLNMIHRVSLSSGVDRRISRLATFYSLRTELPNWQTSECPFSSIMRPRSEKPLSEPPFGWLRRSSKKRNTILWSFHGEYVISRRIFGLSASLRSSSRRAFLPTLQCTPCV